MSARVTLRTTAAIDGVGLFSAASVRCRIGPGDDGIRIVRTDLAGAPGARADVRHALGGDTQRNTTIEVAPGANVATVEHLLSALAGLGITDATIEVDGPEIPIGDGSASFIVGAIDRAGTASTPGENEPIVVRDPIRVEGDDGSYVEASPAKTASYEYHLRYPGRESIIPNQAAAWDGDADAYRREVAPARTFCLEEEARAMRAAGMFEHLSTSEMLVLGEDGPIDNALRFDDEPARHKLLDLIGDLALAGRPIRARVVAHRAGHALNREMARRLASL